MVSDTLHLAALQLSALRRRPAFGRRRCGVTPHVGEQQLQRAELQRV